MKSVLYTEYHKFDTSHVYMSYMVYSSTTVYEVNDYVKSGPLYIFISLKNLMILLKRLFQGFISYNHTTDTDSMLGHIAKII